MGSCHDFSQAIGCLPDFCNLAVDLPGHGGTKVASDRNYQMPQVALALVELLKQLEIDRCILVGYSMGGRIALYLASYFPQYFSGVVLESASPGLSTLVERESRISRDTQLARRLISSNLADFLQDWYLNALFDSFRQHPSYPEAIARRLNNDPYKLAKSLIQMGLGRQPDLTMKLARIKLPLLLVVGELDRKFVKIGRKMSTLCPPATLCIVEHSGHNVHLEHPVEFSRLLLQFIDGLLITEN